MKSFLTKFFKDESGASAAEYALILAIVGVALAGAALYLSFQIQQSMITAGKNIEACATNPGGADCPQATPTAAAT